MLRPQGTREVHCSQHAAGSRPCDITLPDPDKRRPHPVDPDLSRCPDDAWEFDDDDDWDDDLEDEDEDDELIELLESSRRRLREQNENGAPPTERTREKISPQLYRDGRRDGAGNNNANGQQAGQGRPAG